VSRFQNFAVQRFSFNLRPYITATPRSSWERESGADDLVAFFDDPNCSADESFFIRVNVHHPGMEHLPKLGLQAQFDGNTKDRIGSVNDLD